MTASVADVIVRRLDLHPDHRGNVRESYRESWFPEVPPVKQLVHSRSLPKTMRAMHAHKRQWDIWHFVDGRALVVLYDLQGGLRALGADAMSVIAIPPGVAHGFYTEGGAVLMYALTEEYDGTDEYGFDPYDSNFPGHYYWPSFDQVLISNRDAKAPPLGEFLGKW